jgi:hypothetical protein
MYLGINLPKYHPVPKGLHSRLWKSLPKEKKKKKKKTSLVPRSSYI